MENITVIIFIVLFIIMIIRLDKKVIKLNDVYPITKQEYHKAIELSIQNEINAYKNELNRLTNLLQGN